MVGSHTEIITECRAFCLALLPALVLSGCAELVRGNGDARKISESENDVIRNRVLQVPVSRAPEGQAGEAEDDEGGSAGAETSRKGGASFFSGGAPLINTNPAARGRLQAQGDGSITFNFIDAAISEVVRTILGDLLDVPYVIDTKVQGTRSTLA